MAYPTHLEHPSKVMIRYVGLFDFDGLYSLMARWLKDQGYWFHERSYKHKVPTPYGAEQEIEWRAEKEVTEYYQEVIEVFIHTWEQTEVEVEKGGVKKKLTSAKLEVKMVCAIDMDYEKRWAKSKFWRAIRDWYHKYVIRKEIEFIWLDIVYHRMYNLQNIVKEFLDMEAKGNEFVGYMGDNV